MKKVTLFGRRFLVPVGTVGLSVVSKGAFAASLLTTEVTGAITDAKADISSVQGLVIGLCVLALAFRWVKATFFS